MKKLRPKSLTPILLALIVVSSSLFMSACNSDEGKPQLSPVAEALILSYLKSNVSEKCADEYSELNDGKFVSFYAKNFKGVSISVTLDNSDGKGVGGKDIPLTPEDDVSFTDEHGALQVIHTGTYTLDEETMTGVIRGSNAKGEEFQIEIVK